MMLSRKSSRLSLPFSSKPNFLGGRNEGGRRGRVRGGGSSNSLISNKKAAQVFDREKD